MPATDFGILHLPHVSELTAALPTWSDCTFNRLAVLVAAVLVIMSLSEIYSLIPYILDSFYRAKGDISLEHNMRSARSRNLIAWLMLLVFSLLSDRFGIYGADFLGLVPPGLSALANGCVYLIYILIRKLLHTVVNTGLKGDERSASKGILYTYFIAYVILSTALSGIFSIFNADSSTIRDAILWLTAPIGTVFFIREYQFLRSKADGFSTILYLCALEIVPAALLIVSATLL